MKKSPLERVHGNFQTERVVLDICPPRVGFSSHVPTANWACVCFPGESVHRFHQLLQESVISRRLRSKRKDSEGSVRGGTSFVGPKEAEFSSGVSWAPLALQTLGGLCSASLLPRGRLEQCLLLREPDSSTN